MEYRNHNKESASRLCGSRHLKLVSRDGGIQGNSNEQSQVSGLGTSNLDMMSIAKAPEPPIGGLGEAGKDEVSASSQDLESLWLI